jgi:hypothetical protein
MNFCRKLAHSPCLSSFICSVGFTLAWCTPYSQKKSFLSNKVGVTITFEPEEIPEFMVPLLCEFFGFCSGGIEFSVLTGCGAASLSD